MKLLHITFHFEFEEVIEGILDRYHIGDYVLHPMVQGKDVDGKHYGSKVYPGNINVIQAQVPEEKLEGLLEELSSFKEEKRAHRHLEALVLPVERRI